MIVKQWTVVVAGDLEAFTSEYLVDILRFSLHQKVGDLFALGVREEAGSKDDTIITPTPPQIHPDEEIRYEHDVAVVRAQLDDAVKAILTKL